MTKNADGAGPQVRTDELVEKYSAKVGAARTRLLDVASKAKDRIPRLSMDEIAILDALMRETLEDIANIRSDNPLLDQVFEQWRPTDVLNLKEKP